MDNGHHSRTRRVVDTLVAASKTPCGRSWPQKYHFLRSYNFDKERKETGYLTDFGRQQLFNEGRQFFQRYPDLSKAKVPFMRGSGVPRVMDSAEHWIKGFREEKYGKNEKPEKSALIDLGGSWRNTLGYVCANRKMTASREIQKAIDEGKIIIPIVRRLNAELKPSNPFTISEVLMIMDMCPFSTAASPNGQIDERWCNLFTSEEWQAYDYDQSVRNFYRNGPGNEVSPTAGVGFVNELMARMLEKPVRDNTMVNMELDKDPSSFPLKNKLYADFSHDNIITTILAAVGAYDQTGKDSLDPNKIQRPQDVGGWASSWAVPLAGRVFFEKMKCDGEKEEMVRVIVNDRVMPMKRCKADNLGRCKLDQFVYSQGFARHGGKWAECKQGLNQG
jgi:hypothetical protein